MGNTVSAFTTKYCFRVGKTIISTDKGIAACIKSADFFIYRIYGLVITTFTIYSLMIDSISNYFYFSD